MRAISNIVMYPKKTIRYALIKLIQKTHFLWTDKFCVRMLFFIHFGKRLNLTNPRTFNEKLNWLKLYNHDNKYTKLADKYEVKKYVASTVGENYVVKNYGVWNSFDEIEFDKLPNEFVLKATHDSGGVIICYDKSDFDADVTRKKLNKIIKRNFYYISWEWPYKNINARIIADEYLYDGRKGELQDYKFWCFNGKPLYMYITNKGKRIFENFYDMNFSPVDINHGFPRFEPEYNKPACFDEMKELAVKLSKDIPFVRVDFFEINNKVYFGEFTFFDWGGEQPFSDEGMDIELGKLITLPVKQII